MATVSSPIAIERTALEFMEALGRSGILSTRQIEQIQAKVQGGSYLKDAQALAAWLVKKQVLTNYQARHLLHGQSQVLLVGRYVILDRIGRGAMGTVYKARHRLMGRVAALKFIAPAYLARPNAVPRFLREMRLVGRLNHPNIVQAYDADQVGGVPYIVMEYVPGQDLERLLLGRGPLPPEDTVRYVMQVALGLAHAHEQGIIHRDIKPSNLLLGDDGRIRILDLGLAALLDNRDPDRGSAATRDGMAVGTADYMSPEQAVGREAPDGRSDLYSLGCVMYYLLTGRVPFPGDSQVECMASRIKGRPMALGDLRPGLPPGVIGIVERLMANRPDDRYPSAAAAAEALQALGECEQFLSERSARLVENAGTASHGSVNTEASVPHENSTTGSTNIGAAQPCWWLSLLWYLSGWSQRFALLMLSVALLAGSAALLATFAAGFLLHDHFMDTRGGPSGVALSPLSVQSVKE